MLRIEEDFELELRSLPGVLNVGFDRDDEGGVHRVTLVTNAANRDEIATVAEQISALYYPDASVVVDDVNRLTEATIGGRGGARAALVRAESDPMDGSSEVVLNFAGRLATGKATSGPLIGGVEATLAALRQLGFEIPFTLLSVSHMIAVRNWPVVVVLRSTQGGQDRFGIAQSDNDVLGAARATLSALNRLPMTAPTNGSNS